MMKTARRKTKVIKIGNVAIGGNNPVAIQSMAKTRTKDLKRTVKQIKELESAGCEIIRVAVKDAQDAKAIKKIKQQIKIPLVADIHFDWRLAIEAIDSGADKIRLNPGNIYKNQEIREIVSAARANRIPIRVGVNSGSLRRAFSRRSQAERMVKSAVDYIRILEGFNFFDIVISLKASNILDTIEAYRNIAGIYDYPMHLGVTACGLPLQGAIKSSIALGVLILEGIGDVIRISLTGEPAQEVWAAKIILESLGLRIFSPEIISCPTCGRCEVDLVKIVKDLENRLTTPACLTGRDNRQLKLKPLKVAIMGCVVNGPGEAKEADIGVAFGRREGLLFRNGIATRKISHSDCARILLEEMEKFNGKRAER
jgi:(E)-4-hydroxy-3-methylbut-2-enyl-diphosphate synthase